MAATLVVLDVGAGDSGDDSDSAAAAASRDWRKKSAADTTLALDSLGVARDRGIT